MARILVVDDSPVEIKIIRKLLGNQYEVLEALDGKTGIKLALEERPDLILLDILMPEMDGLTVCKQLKQQEDTQDIPVIFITAVSEAQAVVRGFEAGGQDYITKPFYSPELCARIKVHLDLKQSKETIIKYANELSSKNEQLRELMDQIEDTAMKDFTTGLLNRRSMTKKLKEQLLELKKSGDKSALILLDIDDFKKINDSYGHDCGDTILQDAASIMAAVIGKNGVLSRWGGEEFLIMLYNADVLSGQQMAEEIRKAVEISPFRYGNMFIPVTLTLGVTEFNKEQGLDVSIRKADKALYEGKNKSKNCVVVL